MPKPMKIRVDEVEMSYDYVNPPEGREPFRRWLVVQIFVAMVDACVAVGSLPFKSAAALYDWFHRN